MLSNGVTSIGNSAFYYCTELTSVTIPDSVTSIESTAFGDCSDDLCLLGSANSYAERYARENRFVFVCLSQVFSVALTDTTVRSLHSAAIFCRITGSGPVTVRYESANPFVALVDEQGGAQGVFISRTKITATVTDSSGRTVTDTCTVKVRLPSSQEFLVFLLRLYLALDSFLHSGISLLPGAAK